VSSSWNATILVASAERVNRPRYRVRLEAVHETATDLHAAGLIDPRRLRKYGALYLPSRVDLPLTRALWPHRVNGGRVGEVADVT
jgi:hypothetical protein